MIDRHRVLDVAMVSVLQCKIERLGVKVFARAEIWLVISGLPAS